MSNSPVDILQRYLAAAKDALELSEEEMFKAKWHKSHRPNHGRCDAYHAVKNALNIAFHGVE